MLSKAHLTSHSRMSGSRSVITPSWLSGSWSSFLYNSSVYSCHLFLISTASVAATAKSLQSYPTLCDPRQQPTSFPIPGILQARTLEWAAISFSTHESEKWKWSHSVVSDSVRPHGLLPTRLLHPWDFPGKSTGVGCHCFLRGPYYFCPLSSPSLHVMFPWYLWFSWRDL